jgi:hypothetical protein
VTPTENKARRKKLFALKPSIATSSSTFSSVREDYE